MKMNRRSELQIKNRFKKLTNYLEEGPMYLIIYMFFILFRKYYSTDEILNIMSKSSQLSPFISLSKNTLNQSNKNKNTFSLKLSKNEEIKMESEEKDNDNNDLFLNEIIKDEIKRFKQISKYELNPYSLRKGSLLYQKLEEHRLNRNNFIYYINSNMLQSARPPPPPTTTTTTIKTTVLSSPNPNTANISSLPIPISHLHQPTTTINATNIETINNNINISTTSPPNNSSNTHPIYQIPLPPPPTLSEDMEECLENSFPALIPMQSTVPPPTPSPQSSLLEEEQQPIILQTISSSSQPSSSPPSSEDIQLQNNGIPFYVTYYPNNEMINQQMYNNNEYNIKLSHVDYPLIDVINKRDIKELENPFYVIKHFFDSIKNENIKFDLPFSQRFPNFRRNNGKIDIDDEIKELENNKIVKKV